MGSKTPYVIQTSSWLFSLLSGLIVAALRSSLLTGPRAARYHESHESYSGVTVEGLGGDKHH